MRYIIGLFALVLFTFCQRAEKEKTADVTTETKKFEMYDMSEMSALMEQMYVDNQRLKERIKNGDTIGAFPNHFMAIHKAVMTDDSENDAFFKEQAKVFITAQQRIYEDPKNAKEHFNEGVNACVRCHEVKCQGPIPRIKKLYIEQQLKREIIVTEDGSTTIRIPEWDECYHSKHGAIQEAYHVFIKNGLDYFSNQPLAVMEIGFGTGLNAFITFLESEKRNLPIEYVGIEAYPVLTEEAIAMNYVKALEAEKFNEIYLQMHNSKWEESIFLGQSFNFTKRKMFFNEISEVEKFDIIYFDAFGFRVQPELWSTAIFKIMFDALKHGGMLVTYAARGVIKRSMIEVGFTVEKLDGPPGKREMMRAFKS